MARFGVSHGNAQIQTGGRREHDSAPLSAHMCKIDPHNFLPPLMIVGIDALSIGIEYLQEHLIGEIIDRELLRPLCILTSAFTCGKSVGGSLRVANRRTVAHQRPPWCWP